MMGRTFLRDHKRMLLAMLLLTSLPAVGAVAVPFDSLMAGHS